MTTKKTVLDACCGSRMFWFDKKNPSVIYVDKRREEHILKDSSVKGGERTLIIDPDLTADFTDLPFRDESFYMVVFDPPHLKNAGESGWQAKKYGRLDGAWKEDIQVGFAECFRVLRPGGTLIFKWNELQIPVSQILALTSERPLIGQRSGKAAKTHWIVFMKGTETTEQSN